MRSLIQRLAQTWNRLTQRRERIQWDIVQSSLAHAHVVLVGDQAFPHEAFDHRQASIERTQAEHILERMISTFDTV